MAQQIIVYILVGFAAAYVLRYVWRSARSVFEAKKGCGGGCVNCAFAKEVASPGANQPAPRPDFIPLQTIQTLPTKRNRS